MQRFTYPQHMAYRKQRWAPQVQFMDRRTSINRRQFYLLHLVAIVAGLTVPALIAANIDGRNTALRIITIVVSLLPQSAPALSSCFVGEKRQKGAGGLRDPIPERGHLDWESRGVRSQAPVAPNP